MIHGAAAFPFSVRTLLRSRTAIAAGLSGLLVLGALGHFREDALGEAPGAPSNALAESAPPRLVKSDAREAPGEDGARSYSYYPEQLAALRSMSNFTPIADEGVKLDPASAPTPGTSRTPPQPPRSLRRADLPVKTASVGQTVAPPAQAAAPAPVQDQPRPKAKIFGMALPALPDLGQGVKGARDTAARWTRAAAGLGERIAGFWR